MNLKGIIPGHRTQLLPKEEGILISFNETMINLSRPIISPKNLFQIKYTNNLRYSADQLLGQFDKKKWSFCYILQTEIKVDPIQLEMALNLEFRPEKNNYQPNDYSKKYEASIEIRIQESIGIDGWELGCPLPELSGELNKTIWIPHWHTVFLSEKT